MDTKTIIYNIHDKLMYLNWLVRHENTTGPEIATAALNFAQYAHRNLIALPESIMGSVDCLAGELDLTIIKAKKDGTPVEGEIIYSWKEAKPRIELAMMELRDYFWTL